MKKIRGVLTLCLFGLTAACNGISESACVLLQIIRICCYLRSHIFKLLRRVCVYLRIFEHVFNYLLSAVCFPECQYLVFDPN